MPEIVEILKLLSAWETNGSLSMSESQEAKYYVLDHTEQVLDSAAPIERIARAAIMLSTHRRPHASAP